MKSAPIPSGAESPVRRGWFGALLLVASTIAYAPALRGVLVWDDDAHVTKPALQSLAGLVRIWTVPGATQQYYPLLHSAFWLEHRFWGDCAVGYHLVNVALHALAAWWFGRVLLEIWPAGKGKGEAAAVGAVLFALHPVAVESVAWVSEQKNTLSGVFYLSAGWMYLKSIDSAASPGSGRKRSGYAVATVLFWCALLTKSVTATLPAALLVVIWYRRGRLTWRGDVVPLLPWFACGLGMGLFTAWVERTLLGASGDGFALGFGLRCLLAARVVLFYAGKVVWPTHLLFVYPHWTVSAASAIWYAGPAAVLGALAGCLWLWRRRGWRGPLAAALFFGGTLFPALGFFNVYPFLFSYVADHFQYLAMLGPIAVAAAGWGRWRTSDASWRPAVAAAAGVLVLSGLTWRQARNYRDPETLYRSTLAGNPQCWMADYNLGVTLHRQGRIAEATDCYERAIELRPGPEFPQAQNNLGVILTDAGKGGAAVPHLQAAVAGYARNLRLAQDGAEAEGNLGRALQQAGRDAEAVGHFRSALAVDSDRRELRNNYAVALIRSGHADEAERQLELALRLHPDDATARDNLALLRRLLSEPH